MGGSQWSEAAQRLGAHRDLPSPLLVLRAAFLGLSDSLVLCLGRTGAAKYNMEND